MSAITATPIRLALVAGSTNTPVNDFTRQGLQLYRGNPVRFEIGAFMGRVRNAEPAIVDTVEDWESVTVFIKALANDAAPADTAAVLAEKATTSFNTPSPEGWNTGLSQHAVIELTGAQTQIAAGTYWMVFVLTRTTGSPITLAAFKFTIVEDGVGVQAEVEEGDPAYSQDDADALFVREQIVTAHLFGDAALGRQFGFFRPFAGPVKIARMRVLAADAPAGGELTVEILKQGEATGREVTLENGETSAVETFEDAPELQLEGGSYQELRLEVTAVAPTYPGGNLTVQLCVRPAAAE